MSVTQIEMVRQALSHLGSDATAKTIRPWILDNFKTELKDSAISVYKASIRKENGEGGEKKAKRGAGPDKNKPNAKGTGGSDFDRALALVQTLYDLEAEYGRDNLRKAFARIFDEAS